MELFFKFNRIRFNLLIISLVLIGAISLFRGNPLIFFILLIGITIFFYIRFKKKSKRDQTFDLLINEHKEQLARAHQQQNTSATPDVFDKAYSLVQLLGLSDSISQTELEAQIRKKIQFDEKTDQVSKGQVWHYLFRILCDQRAAFWTDWKWGDPKYLTEEYIVKILPDLNPHFEIQERDAKNNWHIKGTFMREAFDATTGDGIPHDFIFDIVNPILEKKISKKFCSYDSGGDDHDFVLVPIATYDQATSNTYKDFWG